MEKLVTVKQFLEEKATVWSELMADYVSEKALLEYMKNTFTQLLQIKEQNPELTLDELLNLVQ